MALTGRFEADFEQFYAATRKAQAELRGMEAQSTKTAASVDKIGAGGAKVLAFNRGLQESGDMLRLVGINAGPAGRAIEELGALAGQTGGELSTLGAAGLAVGAGIAGWKIGRAIADFAELDTKIGDATAKLLGFGDVAAERAAAKQDALARASVNAGRAITDYTEAIRINTAAAELFIMANQKMGVAAKQAAEDIEKVTKVHEANYQKMRQAQIDSDKKRNDQLAADTKTYADMAIRSQKDLRQAEADAAAARATEAAGQVETWKARQDANYAELVAQRDARAEVEQTTAALQREKAAADAARAAIVATQSYDLSTAEGQARFKALNPNATVAAPPDYFKTHTLAEGVAAGHVTMGGAADVRGGAAQPVLPMAAARGGAAGGGPPIVVGVSVSGVFDPASKAGLSRAVSEGLYHALKTTRKASGW